MSRFQEMHDSTLSRSTLSDSKLMKDRLKTRFSKQLSESQTISNVFSKVSNRTSATQDRF